MNDFICITSDGGYIGRWMWRNKGACTSIFNQWWALPDPEPSGMHNWARFWGDISFWRKVGWAGETATARMWCYPDRLLRWGVME